MAVANLHKLRLTLNPATDNYQYDIYPIQTGEGNQRKDAFSVAPPGLAPYQNILLGISGMQDDFTVNFTLYDDGSDRSNGTAPTSAVVGQDSAGNDLTFSFNGTVVTVEEQHLYLKHVIQDPAFDATWELDQLTGSKFNGDEVFVESVEPTAFSVDSPKWKPCRMVLRRGGSA